MMWHNLIGFEAHLTPFLVESLKKCHIWHGYEDEYLFGDIILFLVGQKNDIFFLILVLTCHRMFGLIDPA